MYEKHLFCILVSTSTFWTKILDQDTENGGFFIDKNEALYSNAQSKFSRLGEMGSLQTPMEHLHFKLVYPESGQYNEWLQTSNPLQDESVEGYLPIHTDYERPSEYGCS